MKRALISIVNIPIFFFFLIVTLSSVIPSLSSVTTLSKESTVVSISPLPRPLVRNRNINLKTKTNKVFFFSPFLRIAPTSPSIRLACVSSSSSFISTNRKPIAATATVIALSSPPPGRSRSIFTCISFRFNNNQRKAFQFLSSFRSFQAIGPTKEIQRNPSQHRHLLYRNYSSIASLFSLFPLKDKGKRFSFSSNCFCNILRNNHHPNKNNLQHMIENGSKQVHNSTSSLESIQAKEDAYGGVIIDPDSLSSLSSTLLSSPLSFETYLETQLKVWKEQDKRGIWLQLPINLSPLIPIAVKLGFVYHHAETDYLMLTHWLAAEENTLPPGTFTSVGVGAVVYDERTKCLLVVKEKNGPLKGKGVYKIPTGLLNRGEHISDGAIREVKEETGIDSKYISILTFRHAHGLLHQKSDLFFVVRLRPTSFVIQACVHEIEEAAWIPVEDYMAQPWFQTSELHKAFNHVISQSIALHSTSATGKEEEILETNNESNEDEDDGARKKENRHELLMSQEIESEKVSTSAFSKKDFPVIQGTRLQSNWATKEAMLYHTLEPFGDKFYDKTCNITAEESRKEK